MNSGAVIADARRASGLSQGELARRLGTTQSAIARLESSATNPRIATLERALAAMGQRLELRALPEEVDVRQLERHLSMTPAERLRVHDASASHLRELLDAARPAR